MARNMRRLLIIILVANLVLVAVLALMQSASVEHASVEAGVSYIQAMEALDANRIDNEIYANSMDGRLQAIEDGIASDPDYVWKALADINTVILGDSRVAAFADNGGSLRNPGRF